MRLALAFGVLGLTSLAGADTRLDGRTLRYEAGEGGWTRTFAANLGPLTGPVSLGEQTYLGVGPVVYAFSPAGEVLGRADLPGAVTSLDSGGGSVRVGVSGPGYVERFTLDAPSGDTLPVRERVVFPPDPEVTGWLARFADGVDPGALTQAGRDFPLNPFIALRGAERAGRAGNDYEALSSVRRALGATLAFPAWTQLAARLDAAGFPAAANLALDRARRDAAARGLDPALPVSRAALFAYGNPSGYVGTLLDQNRLARAEVWMNFLRELYPRFEGGDALYRRYAEVLEAQGRAGEAEEWRQFARTLRAGSLYNLGPDDTRTLRDAARLTALALALALLAAFLTLTARAWKAQGEDLRPLGGRWRSWRRPPERLRLSALSYASFAERLVLALLAGGLLTALGGWQWANETGRGLQAPALNLGTYGGGWSAARLGELGLRPGPATSLITGLAAQLDGRSSDARVLYQRAGQDACALNNLGIIAQDAGDPAQARSFYRRALTLQPDLTAAAYNLGLNPGTAGPTFQKTYRAGQPRLCYPDRRTLARAVGGDLGSVLRRTLTDPLGFLADRRPATRLDAVILAGLVGFALLVLTLLVPRAASSERLGRPAGFRLLALLLPGSGLLGNAWGGVLLLVWAGAACTLLGLSGPLRFPFLLPVGDEAAALRGGLWALLLGTYALNVLALLLIEAARARRRRAEHAE